MDSQLKQMDKLIENDTIKAIVFDLFTCMINTNVSGFSVFYDIVGVRLGLNADFRKQREVAEKIAIARLPFFKEETNLDQIYNQLQDLFGYSNTEIKTIKQMELAVVKEHCSAIAWAKPLYDKAIAFGKKVVVIAKTHYPDTLLEDILTDNGYSNIHQIYTTTNTALCTKTGRFYEKIKTDMNENFKDAYALVVRSKVQSIYEKVFDKSVPKIYMQDAMQAYTLVKGALDDVEKIPVYRQNSFLNAYLASQVCSKSERHLGSQHIYDDEEQVMQNLGFFTIGPVILSVYLNLIKDAKKSGINKLVFTGKDATYVKIQVEQVANQYDDDTSIELILLDEETFIQPFDYKNKNLAEHLIHPIVDYTMSVDDFIRKKLYISDEKSKIEVLNILRQIGYRRGESKIGEFEQYVPVIKQLEEVYIKSLEKRNRFLEEYITKTFSANDRVGVLSVAYYKNQGEDMLQNANIYRKNYFIFPDEQKNSAGLNDHSRCVLLNRQHSSNQDASKIDFLFNQIIRGKYCSSFKEAIKKKSKGSIKLNHTAKEDLRIKEDLQQVQAGIDQLIGGFCNRYAKNLSNILLNSENLINHMVANMLCCLKNKDSDAGRLINYCADSRHAKPTNTVNYVGDKEHANLYKRLYFFGYKLGIVPLLKKVLKAGTTLFDKKITEKSFEQTYLQALESLKSYDVSGNPKVIFAGMMLGSTKGTIQYINSLWQHATTKDIVLLSQYNNIRLEQSDIERKVYADYIMMPVLLSKNTYAPYVKIKTTKAIETYLEAKPYLLDAVENIQDMNRLVDNGYIKTQIYYVHLLFNAILDKLQPEKVIMWNQFHAFNSTLKKVCEERNIKTMYFEFGVIPGTYVLEKQGQMGESLPAKNYKEFLQLEYTKDDLLATKEVLSFLRETKQNRNIYDVRSSASSLLKKLKKDRPIIMFAGQYDYEAGLYPYTDHAKQYHSPMFTSSNKTAAYLYKLCKKNDWNFIFKPHPLMVKNISTINRLPKGLMVVTDTDIFDIIHLSDVVITLFSQSAYLSLICNKATLMLGYNQLKKKGCAYEAYEQEKIEDEIKAAITHGFTQAMQESFAIHTTQLLKHYLYHDEIERKMVYGKDVKDMVKLIEV